MISLACILAILISAGLYRGFRELTISAHGWGGVSVGSDLFHHYTVLGFVTFRLSKQRMEDRIRELNEALNSFRKDGQ